MKKDSMENIRVLDCTLRDGGRVIDCDFGRERICCILNDLQDAGIDIIELGFIRNKISYKDGTTFFTDFSQIKEYVAAPRAEMVIFVDHGMYDLESIPVRAEDDPVTGIRVGFTKGNFDQAVENMREIKRRGYKLYVQDVDTLAYSDAEIIELIGKFNELAPYSVGIVDTYGAMYREDLLRYLKLFDRYLNKNICIDFHSHNNYQLSFSLAQEVVRFAAHETGRPVIIDATLYGMGKVAGNLNTELIINFLNKKYGALYDLNRIFDSIDENIMGFYQQKRWGYSCDAFLSGIFRAHPNNVIYLTEKFKLDTNDIGGILGMIDDAKRRTYDYDNIEQCYIEYNSSKENDAQTREELRGELAGRRILIVASGYSIRQHEFEIKDYIARNHPVVVSVNFEYDSDVVDYTFFSNQKRYKQYKRRLHGRENSHRVILTSNIREADEQGKYIVDYRTLAERGWTNFDNATILLLRLLLDMSVGSIAIAGFDGMRDGKPNFAEERLEMKHTQRDYYRDNTEISMMFSRLRSTFRAKGIEVTFLTDSLYDI